MTHTVRQGSETPLGIPVYALGTNPAERDRLRRQAEELRDHSAELLDRVGVERGWSAIDLGCGPRGIVDLLADRVGPGGRVTGLEYNPDSVALAREFARSSGLANVAVVEGDARHTRLPGILVRCRSHAHPADQHSRASRGGRGDGAAG